MVRLGGPVKDTVVEVKTSVVKFVEIESSEEEADSVVEVQKYVVKVVDIESSDSEDDVEDVVKPLVNLTVKAGPAIIDVQSDDSFEDASMGDVLIEQEDESDMADTEEANMETMCENDLEERLQALVDKMELTEQELETMRKLRGCIGRVLAAEFPDVQVEPYGSTASGLGVHGCDLDLYISLGGTEEQAGGARAATRRIARILLLHPSRRYRSARAILASTPIVRLRDTATGLKCDLNASSRTGVVNTRYLKFCSEFDPRARDLIMVVKCFCSRHRLTDPGAGSPGGHLNNYTLVTMVVFYLQTQGLLHPLHLLQEVPGLQEEIIDGYNFAFCTDSSMLPPLPHSSATLLELLEGFFDYFAFFPFHSHAVCPMAGEETARSHLHRSGPGLHDSLKLGVPLVVQDPFELRRNVAHAVTLRCLDTTVEAFDTAARLLATTGRGGQVTGQELFMMLFEPGFSSFLAMHEVSPWPGLALYTVQEEDADEQEMPVVLNGRPG